MNGTDDNSAPAWLGGHRGRQAATLLTLVALLVLPKLAPGTVEEQRERLPPAVVCEDPVEGLWKSHSYDPAYGDWTEFYLEIRRVEPGEPALEGTILNHTWVGAPSEEQPGPCRGRLRYRVSMDARGTEENGAVFFGGIGDWRLDEVLCGSFRGGYNLDNFSGQIDPAIQEFQSVNNDGGRAVNEPTVFRRIRCFEPPPPTEISVAPPPLFPGQEEASGGGCW
jgi:hypothetical protein